MKKIYKVLFIAIVIFLFLSSITVKSFALDRLNYENAISNNLSNITKNWLIKNESQFYKDISITLSPSSPIIKGNTAEEKFEVSITETLKASTPDEIPAIKGMEKFKSLDRKKLSPAQLNLVNKELKKWRSELKGYISKSETVNLGLKVKVSLLKNKSIIPGTIKFFLEDAQGGFYRANSLAEPANQMEQEGYDHIKDISNKATSSTPDNFVVDTYRRCDLNHPPLPKQGNPPDTRYYTEYNDFYDYAANYADSFALSYNSQYAVCLNDCANFVSQAMHAGGIPMDSLHRVDTWWVSPPNPPEDYAPWGYTLPVPQNNESGLRNYMIRKGYWKTSSIEWTNAGGVVMWKDNSNYPGHVAMVVQNDTITRALSQHNTDRRHYFYSTTGYYYYNCEFYTVHNYISAGTPSFFRKEVE